VRRGREQGTRCDESLLSLSTSPSGTRTGNVGEAWSVRRLIAAHKPAALGIAAIIAVMLAMILVAALGAKGGAVSDATTCTQWGSANVNEQSAYARLYVREHGPVSPRWGPAPAGIVKAINAGCAQAFGENVSDSVTVVQAISRNF
jgi:hypothetical protein